MADSVDIMLKRARDARSAGRLAAADEAYRDAAALARAENDPDGLAHALRHLSDLARERGDLAAASLHADEAIALYREIADDRLGLANALRLRALSTAAEHAKQYWREARDLYSSLGIAAGFAECDAQISAIEPRSAPRPASPAPEER